MPYKLEKSGSGYFVVDDAGKKHSDKPMPKWRASAQMRALYAAENNAQKGGPGSGPHPGGGGHSSSGDWRKAPKGSSQRTALQRAELAKLKKKLAALRKLTRSTRFISGSSDFKELDIENMSIEELVNAISDLEETIAEEENISNAKAAPTKAGVPASAFLVVDDPAVVGTWHLQVMTDGKPDHRLMGAAWAALHGGYRGNKYEGPNKQAALDKLKKLYASEEMPLPSEKGFHIFKQADGQYRWVTISSSAFRDRDGEIVTAKALADDVTRCDANGSYGPLRWWHVGGWDAPNGIADWPTWKAGPGIDLGTCDFNMLHGKMLVESGTFKDAATGEAFGQVQDQLEVSIAFSHPPDEPGKAKQYKNIHRFERSLLPEGMASNLLTKFYISKGAPNMKTTEKLAALMAILKGKPELAQQILADAEGVQKAAEAAGLEFKEVESMISGSEEPPVEEVIQSPEVTEPVAEVEPVAEDKAAPAMPEVEPVEIGDWSPEQLTKFIMDVMKAGMEKKEADVTAQIEPLQHTMKQATDAITALTEQVTALAQQSEETQQSLQELTDSRPVGVKQMQSKRATERETNIVEAAPTGPRIDPEFINFMRGGNRNG